MTWRWRRPRPRACFGAPGSNSTSKRSRRSCGGPKGGPPRSIWPPCRCVSVPATAPRSASRGDDHLLAEYLRDDVFSAVPDDLTGLPAPHVGARRAVGPGLRRPARAPRIGAGSGTPGGDQSAAGRARWRPPDVPLAAAVRRIPARRAETAGAGARTAPARPCERLVRAARRDRPGDRPRGGGGRRRPRRRAAVAEHRLLSRPGPWRGSSSGG